MGVLVFKFVSTPLVVGGFICTAGECIGERHASLNIHTMTWLIHLARGPSLRLRDGIDHLLIYSGWDGASGRHEMGPGNGYFTFMNSAFPTFKTRAYTVQCTVYSVDSRFKGGKRRVHESERTISRTHFMAPRSAITPTIY